MGALTSKPYAFSARPWELTEASYFDHLDTAHSPLRVSLMFGVPVRVLPDLRRSVLDEWISDRARFSYDSYTSASRLLAFTFQFKRKQHVSWFISRAQHDYFLFRVCQLGRTVLDWSSLTREALFSTVRARLGAGPTKSSSLFPFLFPSLEELQRRPLFIVGLSLRYTHPVYFALVRQAARTTTVFELGEVSPVSTFSLGAGVGAFFSLFRFKSRPSSFLAASFFLVSQRLYERFSDLFVSVPFVIRESPQSEVFPYQARVLALASAYKTYELPFEFYFPLPHPYQAADVLYGADGGQRRLVPLLPHRLPFDPCAEFYTETHLNRVPAFDVSAHFTRRSATLYSTYNHYDHYLGWSTLSRSTYITLVLKYNENYRHSHFCSI